MSIKTPREKYQNDPHYAQLVRMLESLIEAAQLTPSEVRECAVLACINYEMRHTRRFFMPKDMEEALSKLQDWRESQEQLTCGAGEGGI